MGTEGRGSCGQDGQDGQGRAGHYCVSGIIGMNSHCHVSRQCLWSRGPYHDLCV